MGKFNKMVKKAPENVQNQGKLALQFGVDKPWEGQENA